MPCYTLSMAIYILNLAILVLMLGSMSVSVESADINESVKKPASRYTLYLGGRPAFIQDYQQAILKEILAQNGEAEIQVERTEVTSLRAEKLVAEEKIFDLSISTIPEHEEVKGLIRIAAPIHNGLLGLRHLIIHKDNRDRFLSDFDIDAFSQMSVGQGSSWSEMKIYQHAGIPITGSHEFGRLFDMLKLKRIAYLPLGVIEARMALKAMGDNYRELEIVEDVYILYAMPSYIVVSEKNAELAEKVRIGLREIQESGRLTSLFNRYFSRQLESVDPSSSTLVVLANPLLPKDENNNIIQSVIDQYFASGSRLIYLPTVTNSQTSKVNVNN